MSSTAFNLERQTAPTGPWEVGTYLTDGRRLLCVVGVMGETLELEDSSTECVECWPLRKAVASLHDVKPSLAA
jgi:hypothetical protein